MSPQNERLDLKLKDYQLKLHRIAKKLKRQTISDESAISKLARTLKIITRTKATLIEQIQGIPKASASKKRTNFLTLRAVYKAERQIKTIFALFLLSSAE